MPIAADKIVHKKYDFGGMLIFLAGTTALFMTSFLGGTVLPWTSPILYLFVVAAIIIYALGLKYEAKVGDIALVSVRLLKNKSFMSSIIVGCMFYASFNVKTYEQIVSVQALGMPLAMYTAAKVIPAMIGNGFGVVYPMLMQKTGWYRGISGFIVVLNVVSMILWGTMRSATFVTIFVISVFSCATPQSLGQLLAVNSVDKEDMGTAGGTYTFMYFFSSAMFSLIYNMLMNNVHIANLRPLASAAGILDKLTPAQLQTMSSYNVLASAKNLATFKATFGTNTEVYNKAITVITQCVMKASDTIFFVSAALTATAIIGVIGLRKDMKIPLPKSNREKAVSGK
jgi:hypothetical protein